MRLPTLWADRPGQSWLVSAHELKRLLAAETLDLHQWNTGKEAATAMRTASSSVRPARRIQLDGLLDGYGPRLASLRANLLERRVELIQAVVTRRQPLLEVAVPGPRHREVVAALSAWSGHAGSAAAWRITSSAAARCGADPFG
jgi:hypothetical protein